MLRALIVLGASLLGMQMSLELISASKACVPTR
jgi:hypothetical protein